MCSTDGSRAVYTDPRRFGIIDLFPAENEAGHKLLASLGPEPFDPWDARALAQRLKGRKTAIKLALLDQKVVVGVGNIYVCESLFRAGISPRREAGGLVRKNGQPTARLETLVGHIKNVIEEAIQAGGSTSTISPAWTVRSATSLIISPCTGEKVSRVKKQVVAAWFGASCRVARSTFFCPTCQR